MNLDKKELTAVYDISDISEKKQAEIRKRIERELYPIFCDINDNQNKTIKDGNNAKYDPSMALYSYAVIV